MSCQDIAKELEKSLSALGLIDWSAVVESCETAYANGDAYNVTIKIYAFADGNCEVAEAHGIGVKEERRP